MIVEEEANLRGERTGTGRNMDHSIQFFGKRLQSGSLKRERGDASHDAGGRLGTVWRIRHGSSTGADAVEVDCGGERK